ncbi:MAG TPA: nucleotidyltransferase family protein [Bacteroidales bacterium]|nr:nucleotidyltransferase family protein [Bacteroidales bacterium]
MPENPLKSLPPELRLLIALCRLEFSDREKMVVAGLVKEVKDWDYFVRMVNLHGVVALAWNCLNITGNANLIPTQCLDYLHQGYIKSISRNTKIYSLLDEVLKIAGENGIRVILLKGLALELQYYGNMGLRQMNDLDLLVKKEDAVRFRNILLGNGFSSMPIVSPLHEKFLPGYGKHLPEMYRDGLTVEIHFSLFHNETGLPSREFFREPGEIMFGEQTANVLSPAHNFLYLVNHLDHHERQGYSQARLYTDIFLIARADSFRDMSQNITDLADRLNIREPIEEKMFVLGAFWDLSISDSRHITGEAAGRITGRFIRLLESPREEVSISSTESTLKEFRNIKGLFNKAVFATGTFIPSMKFMKYRYGTRSAIQTLLYYPYRWVILLKSLIFR